MATLIDVRVQDARDGRHPSCLARMSSGWAVMGDVQVLPGYCLLLPDPVAPDLNSLTGMRRQNFLHDMARLGDAVLRVTNARRINYEILGNLEPALHAHVIPRYDWEPEELRTKPVWLYDWDAQPKFDPRHDKLLLERIRHALEEM